MSLTGAMYAGFTGIASNGVSVDVVGDNLANLNTTAFKSQRTLFETLLYRTVTEGKVTGHNVAGISVYAALMADARAALAAAAATLLSAFFLLDTHPTGSWEGKLVLVPKGSRLPEVVGILREGGILPHPSAFRALVLLTFSGRRLHYGEYAFPTPPSTFETWRRLVRGDVIKYEVTVPPGTNLYDVAKLLEEKRGKQASDDQRRTGDRTHLPVGDA